MKNKIKLSFIVVITMLLITGMESRAQDWHQWRGPNREGIFKATDLNLNWLEKTPALLWTFREAGMGYSAPTVVGTTLYCQGAVDEQGFAFAIDTKTGNLKWKQELGKESVPDRENAPRGSVTVDGDKLYLIRGIGQLHCLSAADGKVIWQKDFIEDFKGKLMSRWGYSESPLIDGNLIICSPGGGEGTMIALDKNSGDIVWRSNEWTDDAGHSSPIIAEVYGIRQYIQQASKGVAGVSAKDGKLLWKIEYPPVARQAPAVIPTPVYYDNMVHVTNGYNNGCMGIKLTKADEGIKAETVYANKDMENHHGGVILLNGYIYGYSTSGWACQNLKTGEIVWSQRIREVGKGALLIVNEKLLCLDENTGLLTIAAASPDGWKEFGRMPIPERTNIQTTDNKVWPHPVVANGKLYIRDHDLLFCFDLKK